MVKMAPCKGCKKHAFKHPPKCLPGGLHMLHPLQHAVYVAAGSTAMGRTGRHVSQAATRLHTCRAMVSMPLDMLHRKVQS